MKCPLFDFCDSITATCRVKEPDEGCYYYRYFRDLINRKEAEKHNMFVMIVQPKVGVAMRSEARKQNVSGIPQILAEYNLTFSQNSVIIYM